MTTTKTARLHIVKIEDHEGDGTCTACGREGLRWIVTLSDGTQVGTECTKRVTGAKPAPKSYTWVGDFRIVAEHDEYGTSYVLWQHKDGRETRETRDGTLTAVGGIRQAWAWRGWI
jgi:hypothetical protein